MGRGVGHLAQHLLVDLLQSVAGEVVAGLLRVLENPRDELAWFRILQLVDGVGPATARRMMSGIGVFGGGSGASPLLRLLDLPFEVPVAGREDFEELRAALAECGARGEEPPASAQILRLRRFCDRVFARRYPAVRSRLHDLEQLELIAGGYASRGRFIADLTIDPPSGTGDLAGAPLLDEDFVVLSTVHSAKGSEWDVVHVIHAADGMIPSDMATPRPGACSLRGAVHLCGPGARHGGCGVRPGRGGRRLLAFPVGVSRTARRLP